MITQTLTIPRGNMITLLNEVERPTFVHLVTETKVRMNKKGNPYHEQVTKCLSSNFYIGSSYEDRVNNNRVKEGVENDFVSSPLSGKNHISKCVLTNTNQENGVKFYLMCEWFKRSYPKVEYKYNGNSIDRQLFQSFEVKRKESEKQQIENKVNIVTYLIESIKEIRMNRTRYILID
jgi:hypothetical protein